MNTTAHYQTAPEDRIPLLKKVTFSSGHLVNQLYPAAVAVFFSIMVMTLKMDPMLAGLLFALPRLWDALIDPLMGYITDNTRTKWGRRRPYLFFSAIVSGIFFAIMWRIDPENSQMYNFWYFLGFSLLYYTAYTVYATPLIAMTYEMTPDFHERTRLTAVTQWIGQLAWVLGPWLWVIVYIPELFETPVIASRKIAALVCITCIVLGVVPAIFNKEPELPKNLDKINYKKLGETFKKLFHGVAITFKNKPFVKLCGSTFLVFNSYQIVSQFAFFIIVYYLFHGIQADAAYWPGWFGTVGALATLFLVIPFVTWLSQKIGKKKAFIIATFISIIGYVLKWWTYVPEEPWMMLIPLPLVSFGIGGLFTLMMSMTADVCDLDELETGSRREGTFGAVYWWMVKFGQAIAFFLSGAIIKWVGFDNDIAQQSAEFSTKLRIADIIIPSVSALIAVWVIWKYDLTEKKAHEIREELENRRGKIKVEA